jgi:recombination protein RecT
MTRASVRGAAEAQENEGALAVMEHHRGQLIQVLPSHLQTPGLSDGWYASAQAALRKDKDLWAAAQGNPGSLMNALTESARLGLTPGTDEYYLTVRGGKVLGIIGYQGHVELIYRAGATSSVIVDVVRDNDIFIWRQGEMRTPVHQPEDGIRWFDTKSRGPVIGGYAYAVMVTGAVSQVVIVDDERIQRAMEASATAKKSHSPWSTDYAAMVRKTGAHDLTKWVPTSPEFLREQARVALDAAAQTPLEADPPALPVIDGDVVDEPPAADPAH